MSESQVRFPLSLTQKDIYFDQLHNSSSPLYNIGGYIQCNTLDLDKIKAAHRALVVNHDAFGIRIVASQNDVEQYISDDRLTDLPVHDFSGSEDPKSQATAWLDALFQTPIAYKSSQMCFGFLLKLADDQYWYVGLSHHLAMDGWGFANWAHRLADYYNAKAQPSNDSGLWQSTCEKDIKYLSSNRYQNDTKFWQEHCQSMPEKLLSPQYASRFNDQDSIPSARHRIPLSRANFELFTSTADAMGVGTPQLFIGMLSCYFALAYNQNSISFGIPAHNRRNSIEKEMVAVFTSVSPLVIDVDKSASFASLLQQIAKLQKASFRHQRFPIGHMVKELKKSGAHTNLFDISFNYLKLDYSQLAFDGVAAEVIYHHHHRDEVPLTVTIWDGDGNDLELQLDHHLGYFSREEVRLLGERFEYLLTQICANSSTELKISELTLLPPNETQLLHHDFQAEKIEYDRSLLIHELFEQQVERTPSQVAVTYKGQTLNYLQLNERANQLAHYLKEQGLNQEELVGICIDRGVDMLVTLLAVLKAGGAYVALDPSYPKERLAYIASDAGMKFIVTQDSVIQSEIFTADYQLVTFDCDSFRAKLVLQPTHNLMASCTAQQLAYVLYTSGSTGTPKGVQIEHRNVVAFIKWAQSYFCDKEMHKVLASTSLNFDLSVFELFAPLSVGGGCVIVDNILSLMDSDFQNPGVTLINSVPSGIKAVFDASSIPDSVLAINSGGEPLPKALVNEVITAHPALRVVNVYGPTEDTVYATAHTMTRPVVGEVLIGHPIANGCAYVLDERGQLAPIGVTGELHLAGERVSRGYINHPGLTAAAFIDSPFATSQGGKLYKTGDLACFLADGNLAYRGRIGDQVKIRGFRIELGEIEHHLLKCSDVRSVVVLAHENEVGDKRLIAYVQRSGDKQDSTLADELSASLALKLPQYMIPSVFSFVDEWPLTANGKIDKKALPNPDSTQLQAQYVAAETDTEETLCKLWSELLDLDANSISTSVSFFSLGGHSLLAMRLVADIQTQFACHLEFAQVFSATNIRALAALIDEKLALKNTQKTSVSGCSENTLVMSPAQQSMWLIDRAQGSSVQYNMPEAMSISGNFNREIAQQTLSTIIARHEPLHTIYQDYCGAVVPKLRSVADFSIEYTDLSCDDTKAQPQLIERQCSEFAQRPFDLSSDLMVRVKHIHLGDDVTEHNGILLFNIHHIGFDGWSIKLFINEFNTLYTALLKGEQNPLTPLEATYSDYACWQQAQLSDVTAQSQLNYWAQQLAGLPQAHSIPLDRPRPAQQSYTGATYHSELNCETVTELSTLCRTYDASLFMGLHAIFAALLARYSAEQDIVIGTPVANREQAEVSQLMGMFVNSLVLRTDLSGEPNFGALIEHSKEVLLSAYANQKVSFEQVVERLQPTRNLAHSPLFQVMIVQQDEQQIDFHLPEVSLCQMTMPTLIAKYDLTLSVKEHQGAVILGWEYNSDLFDGDTIERMAKHFNLLAKNLVIAPLDNVFEAPLLSDDEQVQQLIQWNPVLPQSNAACIHELFEVQALAYPDSIALSYKQQTMSYASLNAQSNQLARYLREHRQIGPDTRIGICLDRSLEMVVTILAVLKAGGAYVPLDPASPKSRIDYIRKDAQLSTIVTQYHLSQTLALSKGVCVCLDDTQLQEQVSCNSVDNIATTELGIESHHLAYVIYTSGSTGQPKGVLIEHQNVSRLLATCEQDFEFKHTDVWTLFHSFAFDFSVWEMWGALFYGAKLVIVPQDITRSTNEFYQLIKQEQVSILSQTPSAFSQLSAIACAENSSLSLRYVVFGGEALNFASLSPWVMSFGDETPKLINMYGITETTVHVTYQRVREADVMKDHDVSVIGRSLPDLTVQLMDAHQNLVPIGVIGEMYVGGAGVARGYLNLPELTAERFVTNPYFDKAQHIDCKRLYRSGDLARWLPNGTLEYMGRIDHQVKVRGFRIELGEIEHTLTSLSQVSESTVLVHKRAAGEKQLVAYITSQNSDELLADDEHSYAAYNVFIAQLKQELAQHLPEYMVPAVVMMLPALPLTENGKIDRRALPTPESCVGRSEYVAPSSELEKQLIHCWSQLLALPEQDISVTANFFEIGGSSLLSSRMIHLCNEQLDVTLRIKDIFECSTVQALAARIETTADIHNSSLLPMHHYAKHSNVPLSYTQSRIWLVEQLKGKTSEHNMPIAMKLNGLVDANIMDQALAFMLARHDSLRTQIDMHDGHPYQVVTDSMTPVLNVFDISHLSETDKLAKIRLLAYENGTQTFNLSASPLLRILLIKLSNSEYQLHINFHHIISDGWSMTLFINELLAVYDAFSSGKTPQLPVLKFNYQDFALWQKAFLESNQAESQTQFWQQYLLGCNEQLSLPYQHKTSQTKVLGSNKVLAHVNKTLVSSLQNLASRHQGSLFNVMHAALALLLGRVSGENDFNIGIPVTGRNIPGTQNILGAFLNNLPVRSQLDLGQSFSKMLSDEVKNVSAVLSNQDLPFEHILAASEAKRGTDITPLFQVFLNMLSLPEVDAKNETFAVELEPSADVGSKFNITLYVIPTDAGIELHCNFNNKLFSESDIEGLVSQYVHLLQQVSDDSNMLCGQYSLVQKAHNLPNLAQAQQQLWQGPVHQCFEHIVSQVPKKVAVTFKGTEWRYDELDVLVDYYAQRLANAGVCSGDTVAIMTQRSDSLVIATLAVLKAGAAFMMLSKTVPARRILQQIQSVIPTVLVNLDDHEAIDTSIEEHLVQTGCKQVQIIADKQIIQHCDTNQRFVAPEIKPNAPACIGFTSGTSGQPKAVIGRHSALSIFMPWMRDAFSLSAEDRFGMMSGLVHDPLQRDMFTPLCMGATLCIPEEEDFDMARLNDWLLENRISVLHLTPSLGNMLSGSVERPICSLRQGFFVGEALTTGHVRKFKEFAPNMSVVNLYGSTETSRAVSYFKVDEHREDLSHDVVVPVGRGIQGVQLALFNELMTPCGVGEVGQIGVRSEHLSLGYGNDPILHRQRFIQNPASENTHDIIYLTGDLGYYREDGNVVCLGRIDQQVKIRGFRVELAEIEAVLKRHENIHQVAVTTQMRGQDEVAIVGCVVLSDSSAGGDSKVLRTWLAERLPDYMIPAHLVVLPHIPMTENGKLDSQKLSSLIQVSYSDELVPPANDLEVQLLKIWCQLLDVEHISTTDDFFSIGGHSLLTTRLLSQIKQQFGVGLEYKTFFDDSSIRTIAKHIENSKLANSVFNSNKEKNKNKVIL